MEQKLGEILKGSKSFKELYINLRKNDKYFIRAGYCVDRDGYCEPDNCSCQRSIYERK